MEIQKRITIQFAEVVAVFLLLSLILIYLLFASYRKDEFTERLNNKALSVAQYITDMEKFDPTSFIQFEKSIPGTLSNEKILLFNDENKLIYASESADDKIVTDALIARIKSKKSFYKREGSIELTGLYYQNQTENVVVICYAEDVLGFSKLRNLRFILLMVFLFSIFLILFLGRLFAKKALRPIAEIIDQVNNIDINNLQQRVLESNGKDEISLLAATFNEMLQRLEIAFKTQKDFISNASHELRTPLTSITGSLEVTLLKERTKEEYKQTLHSTLEEVKSLNRLTNRLLTLLHTVTAITDSSFAEVRIDDIIWKARSEYLNNHNNHIVEISFDDTIQGENSFKLYGNDDLLKIVFLNLIENGCKYSFSNRIDIHFAVIDESLQITFTDEGIGIPENEIEQIVQPFYRASNVKGRKGHGIGLSLVERIIALHSGNFQISSTVNIGTTITLSFSLA